MRQLQSLIGTYRSPEAFAADALDYKDPARAAILKAVVDFLLDSVPGAQGPDAEGLRGWADRSRPQDYLTLRIRGFGLAGFQYLRMLFGANTTKPDVHVAHYVALAVGHPVSDVEALFLLERAVVATDLRLRDIDTAIWESSARGAS